MISMQQIWLLTVVIALGLGNELAGCYIRRMNWPASRAKEPDTGTSVHTMMCGECR